MGLGRSHNGLSSFQHIILSHRGETPCTCHSLPGHSDRGCVGLRVPAETLRENQNENTHMPRKLSPQERKVAFSHTIDQVQGLKLQFTANQADKLCNYNQAIDDVKIAIDCIKKVVLLQRKIKRLDDLIISSLWQKAIMSYGRCFNKPLRLQATKVFKSTESLTYHQSVQALRDQYIGHQGSHPRAAREVIVIVRNSKNGYWPEFHDTGLIQIGNYLNPTKTLRHFKLLIAGMEAEAKEIVNVLGKQVMKEPRVLRWIVQREKASGSKLFDHIQFDLLPND